MKGLIKIEHNIENPEYLTKQIITYIGNKRSLVNFIFQGVEEVKKELGKDKLYTADLFSGSGIISRALRQHSYAMVVNDMEKYCTTLSKCYLSNAEQRNMEYLKHTYQQLINDSKELKEGFISQLYAPKDDELIGADERVFYTRHNAMYIDTIRQAIEKLPKNEQHYFIAPLVTEASIKANTSGIFKGFYKNSQTGIGQFGGDGKNALSRICANIELPFPVFSNYSCKTDIFECDALEAAKQMNKVDMVYLDPPYNQHPYGSNYFMLNLINDYKKPESISKVSGIPTDWNRSQYNKKMLLLNLSANYVRL